MKKDLSPTPPRKGGTTTVYFEKRSTMTAYAELAPRGVNYRTRLNCACPEGQNRRNGILVVKGDRVVEKLVRCRACAKTGGKEAHNG